jgi:hypothetical protein
VLASPALASPVLASAVVTQLLSHLRGTPREQAFPTVVP